MIKFKATFNPSKKCIYIDGEGQAEIKFTTDATQLASVLASLAEYKDKTFDVILQQGSDAEWEVS